MSQFANKGLARTEVTARVYVLDNIAYENEHSFGKEVYEDQFTHKLNFL